MRSSLNDGKLAEIFVQSYQNALLSMRVMQNFIVARVLRPITGPNRVVSGGLKRVAHGA